MAINKLNFSGVDIGKVNLPQDNLATSMMQYGQQLNENDRQRRLDIQRAAESNANMLMTQARFDREQDQWKMQDEERKRLLEEKAATNEAVASVLDPKMYVKNKLEAEQVAAKQGMMNLSPEERAVAEQQLKANYQPEVSGKGWLSGAMVNPNVDQTKILGVRASKQALELGDPTSDAFKAVEAAKLDTYEKQQAIANKFKMAQDAASEARADRKALARAKTTVSMDDGKGNIRSMEVPTSKLEDYMAQGWLPGTMKSSGKAKGDGADSKPTDFYKLGVELAPGEKESGVKIGTSLDLVNKQLGPEIANKLYNTIEKGKEGTIWDTKPELDIDNVKTAFGNMTATNKEGKTVHVADMISDIYNNPDKYKVDLKEGQKKPVITKEGSDADKIRELASSENSPTESTKLGNSMKAPETNPLLKEDVVSTMNSLRNPLFGTGITESGVKEKIDAKYGAGTYDKYKNSKVAY